MMAKVERSEKRKVSVRRSVWEHWRREAAREERSVSWLIRHAVDAHLAGKRRKK